MRDGDRRPLRVLVMSGLLLSACSENAAEQEAEGPEQIATASAGSHCFRNEYPIDDTSDLEELIVVITGDRAAGQYNWLPAYKDKRFGQFDGSVDGNTIEARYDYRQEGSSATTMISIVIEEEQAIVQGGPPELGLDRALARVDC